MRKHLLALAVGTLALGSAACTDVISGLGSYDVTGSYQLRTFNGASLPAISYQDAFQQHQLLSETFTIYSDGTYTDDYTVRIFSNSGTTTRDFRDVGTYTQNNSALQFRDSGSGDVFTGSINGNVLTVSQLGDVYVYQR
jgi:hypothetical protein